MDAAVVEQNDDSARLRFDSNFQTLENYPFPFTFDVIFSLTADRLAVDYEIINRSDENMLFSVGSHPAFALDTVEGTVVEFSQPETLDLYGLNNAGLLFKRVDRWFKREQQIPLTERTFKDDALIFKNITSRTIPLKTGGGRPDIEVDIRHAPHLGLWAKPGAPYVCIEPWHGFADAANSDGIFQEKPGILTLPVGQTFKTGYSIRA